MWDTDEEEEIFSQERNGNINKQSSYYCSFLLLAWQYKFHLSNAAMHALLLFIKAFLSASNMVVWSDTLSAVVQSMPNTVTAS